MKISGLKTSIAVLGLLTLGGCVATYPHYHGGYYGGPYRNGYGYYGHQPHHAPVYGYGYGHGHGGPWRGHGHHDDHDDD